MDIKELKVQAYDLHREVSKDKVALEAKMELLQGKFNQIEALEKEQTDG